MSERIVWILGAGFSRSLGAPLLADLFSSAQFHRVSQFYPVALGEDAAGIIDLYVAGVHDIRGAQPVQHQWAHAEEFLERLDIAARNGSERTRLAGFCQVAYETFRVQRKLFLPSLQSLTPRIESEVTFGEVHRSALALLAAECCAFLEHADTKYERWQPYMRWAKHFREVKTDTIITFNYDCIPERLQSDLHQRSLWPVAPAALISARRGDEPIWQIDDGDNGIPVLKLHGSVSWRRNSDDTIEDVKEKKYALDCAAENLALATPGPTKQSMAENESGLGVLWHAAAEAIRSADALVLIGYQIPPTDAYTRGWLVKQLQNNDRRHTYLRSALPESPKPTHLAATQGFGLPVYTVLGPNTNSPESLRVKGMLERLGGIRVVQEPMWAEDFLAVFDRDQL